MIRLVASFVLLVVLLFSPLLAQQSEQARLLRIGYLLRDEVGHAGEAELEAFRAALLADDSFRDLLRQAGFTGIGLFPSDGAEDMQRRLLAEEFQLAFVPAKVYAARQATYLPILISRRPEDFFAGGGTLVRRYGVVLVSPRSPLFDLPLITAEALREELDRRPLAVGGAQSVAAFDAPLLAMATRFGVMQGNAGLLWMGSSEDVVRAVLSGLTDIGATEAGALRKVLADAGLEEQKEGLVRVIVETSPVVTDPVIVNRAFAARHPALVRELRDRLREQSNSGDFGTLRYVPAEERDFLSLRETVRAFERLVGEVPR